MKLVTFLCTVSLIVTAGASAVENPVMKFVRLSAKCEVGGHASPNGTCIYTRQPLRWAIYAPQPQGTACSCHIKSEH